MVLFWWFVVILVCICGGRVIGQSGSASGDSLVGTANASADEPKSNGDFRESNYQQYDLQTQGFNSTKIKSDPIVLVDTKTLFIPNLRYTGENKTLNFWCGTGSPYSQSQFGAEIEFVGNNSNVYINFKECNLNAIDYFSVGDNESSPLDYVTFAKVDRSKLPLHQEHFKESQKKIFRLPKCCPPNEIFQPNTQCGQTDDAIILDIPIFLSNSTGLEPNVTLDKSEYEVRTYFNPLTCDDNRYAKSPPHDVYGLIFNSSLIVRGDCIRHLGEFCIEEYENETIALICVQVNSEEASISPNIYLPVLFISMICFATSAGIYCFILKVKDIHKRCFIIFSISMTLTFFSLIMLQVQNIDGVCNTFGFLFIFFTVLSFIWLGTLCFDLVYKVRYIRECDQKTQRFYWYIGVSVSVSLLILSISLFSGNNFVPDVPSSFVKAYGDDTCKFLTTTPRIFIFFTPMAASFAICFASLAFVPYYYGVNERTIRNNCDWVENRNSCKYLLTSYTILVAVACFWLVNVSFNFLTMNNMTQLALDVIEASLGIVTISIFICNKYTMREIRQKLSNEQPGAVTEEALELNNVPTPKTPLTPSDEISEPVFPVINGSASPEENTDRTFTTFNR